MKVDSPDEPLEAGTPARPGRSLEVLVIYSQTRLWSMGEGKGAASFARTLISLAARGHTVRVSLPAEQGQAPGTETYEGCFLHRESAPHSFVPRARRPLPLRLWERFRLWQGYRRWAVRAGMKIAESHRPDLVLALGPFEVPVARAIGLATKAPNVSRLYGAWSRLGDPIRFRANFPEVAAMRTPAEMMLMTNDGSEGDRVAKKAGFPMERFVFLRNGLEFDRFAPGPPDPRIHELLGLDPGQPLVLAVGRLSFEKKLDRAIRAMPDLLARIPDAALALVGDGEDTEILRQTARDLGVGSQVHFPGAVVRAELPSWYRSADLCISLLDRTNANNPVFEAMGCGVPVVALDVGSTREVVIDGETGRSLPLSDLPQLGNHLADLLARPEERARLGRNARKRIEELLVTPEERLAIEIDLLERVARGKSIARWSLGNSA